MYNCIFCDKTIADGEEAYQHVAQEHNCRLCVSCEGIFPNEEKYNSHHCVEYEEDNSEQNSDQNSEQDSEHNEQDENLDGQNQNMVPMITPELDEEAWNKLFELHNNNRTDFLCFCGNFFSCKSALSKHHKNDCAFRYCACERKLANVNILLSHKCKKQNNSQVRK